MAALTRRTWATIKTEVLKRIGRSGDTTIAGPRVEHWVDAAYRLICRTWHHHELDSTSLSQALAAGARTIALPADCHLVIAVRLRSATSPNPVLGRLSPSRSSFITGLSAVETARPKEYSRFGNTLYLDSIADTGYLYDLFYYKDPVAVDFASGGSALDQVYDEVLISGASQLGLKGYWSPDLGSSQAETMESWMGRMGDPMLASGLVADQMDGGTQKAHGGPKG